MKFLFPCFLCFSLFANAQTDVAKAFVMSPTQFDQGSMLFPNGNGYALFGYGGGANAGNSDIFMLRLDQDGAETGRNYYGLPNKAESLEKGVVPVGNDGWLIAGNQVVSGSGATIIYLVRVGANGNVIWSKSVSEPGMSNFRAYSLSALPTGGFMLSGLQWGELAVVRFSETGEVVWKKTYGNSASKSLYVSESGGNCFVISRNSVLKIRTSNGQLMWEKNIELPVFGAANGTISVDLESIKPLGDRKFVICGTVLNDAVFSYEQTPYASLWDENGEIYWAKAIPVDPALGGGPCSSVLYLPNEQNLLFSGESADGFLVARTDLDGQLLETHNIQAPAFCMNVVLMKAQGRYAATGGCFTSGMNTLFYRSGANWLPSGNLRAGAREAIDSKPLSLSPNPAGDILNLEYWSSSENTLDIRIVNALGQQVMASRQPLQIGSNTVSLDVRSLPPGLYRLVMPAIGLPAIAWIKV
jgi:hypothetical protein